MLRDLIERARDAAPDGFEDGEFRWPPEDLAQFDIPGWEIETPERPGEGEISIEGAVDQSPDSGYIDRVIRERGLDVLAFYRSYHFGERGWGIYVTEAGVRRIAKLLGGDADTAFSILWDHEYFHFLADIAATYVEAEASAPSYLPHHRLRDQRPRVAGHVGWCHIEEGLANGYALDQLEIRTHLNALRDWMRTQPDGYKRGPALERLKTGSSRAVAEAARRELLWHQIAQASSGRELPPDPTPSIFELAHLLTGPTDVPFHWVRDRGELRPKWVGFVASAVVVAMPHFEKRVASLRIVPEWERARELMATNAHHPGLHFKKLKGGKDLFSIRLGRDHRGLLRLDGSGFWTAEDADKRSDVYR